MTKIPTQFGKRAGRVKGGITFELSRSSLASQAQLGCQTGNGQRRKAASAVAAT